ncbi:GNAT family N-acetyltransferase [Glutamicibacter protophormiae]|uniref:GNAT family N-acetyltransferase n=1 Tax=Glutamicibacter protophormiae TaxID=37930 RepID=UPI002A817686|nr:GNAT family N-acetyltransferase [Glutamicibacter protophormiae]WPR65608.1 GNAT family N-acetyltransferase [Glutamicibacter protophormiae]WPR69106.1 GNAT family N-acetyltransferase [Glutamicibacter protophormiae]
MSLIDEFRVTRDGLVIEPALPSDYDRVGDITVDAYLAAGHFDDPRHEYMQFVRKVADRAAKAEVYVARRDGSTIASMTLVPFGNEYADIAREGELEIRMLSVDPAVQRSGAGKAMVHAAIDRARQLDGVEVVSLTTGGTWAAARALYESMGFVRCEPRDWYVPNTEILLVVYTLELD